MSTLSENTVKNLTAQLHGELIQPGDAHYEETRKVYNGMIDRRPALIARCKDLNDVVAAVNFGRNNQMTVSIRGGSGVRSDALLGIVLRGTEALQVHREAWRSALQIIEGVALN